MIERHEQAILLINRRGYATYVSCRQCGYVFRCPQDDMVLTYHRSDKLLKCHHCDYVEELPAVCPQCDQSIYGRLVLVPNESKMKFTNFFQRLELCD